MEELFLKIENYLDNKAFIKRISLRNAKVKVYYTMNDKSYISYINISDL